MNSQTTLPEPSQVESFHSSLFDKVSTIFTSTQPTAPTKDEIGSDDSLLLDYSPDPEPFPYEECGYEEYYNDQEITFECHEDIINIDEKNSFLEKAEQDSMEIELPPPEEEDPPKTSSKSKLPEPR